MKFVVSETNELLSGVDFPSIFDLPTEVVDGQENVDTTSLKEALRPYYGEILPKQVLKMGDSRYPNNAVQRVNVYDKELSWKTCNEVKILVTLDRGE